MCCTSDCKSEEYRRTGGRGRSFVTSSDAYPRNDVVCTKKMATQCVIETPKCNIIVIRTYLQLQMILAFIMYHITYDMSCTTFTGITMEIVQPIARAPSIAYHTQSYYFIIMAWMEDENVSSMIVGASCPTNLRGPQYVIKVILRCEIVKIIANKGKCIHICIYYLSQR